MASITAAIFATRLKTTSEHSLHAFALLFEGSKPYWEIHVRDKIFRFIANPDYILEDGLWQLTDYCKIPYEEYKHDVNQNVPSFIEDEFGEEICNTRRKNIISQLQENGLHYKITTWPGVWMPKLNEKIELWNKAGVEIKCES